MRAKGITYDTGFINLGTNTRDRFDPEVVEHEMRVIRDELRCTAVRVTGGDPDRLELAAKHAARLGLEVWFSPFTCDLTQDEMLDLLADCADRAERLRREGAEVVLVTGAELSLFNVGFLPGETCMDRIDALLKPNPDLPRLLAGLPAQVNEFLGKAAALVRERFGGRITYASIPLERVDWAPFDFVAVDAYRSADVAGQYRHGIRTLVAQGKPVAITEFGCATYRGAADQGARGGMILTDEGKRLDGEYLRDEHEQATYLRELLDIFVDEGVDSAFANTFASYHLPHRAEPREDLDLASYGVVKVLEDGTWQRKAAFGALAGE
ncbi:hypothetical protein [Amycolatopsis sp. GM8]|uniref:hypothetical protein n=1 Tax=Amycolatopsis sp. GM8 TaxID=2896530 RepID=UPI001F1B8309|nr:hypothetical protein [Amycolatopsis sp. GM8]